MELFGTMFDLSTLDRLDALNELPIDSVSASCARLFVISDGSICEMLLIGGRIFDTL